MKTAAQKSDKKTAIRQKYLAFRLGQERFAVDIASVQEIICMHAVTRLPQSPAHVRGVANLRGRVISVVDLRTKFGLPISADGERTCIVISQLRSEPTPEVVGIIVEDVPEVIDISLDQVEETPETNRMRDHQGIITGLAKIDGKVVILVDIKAALTGEDFELIVNANTETKVTAA